MIVCTASQMQAWDAFTIANEPISSADLMERAASRLADRLISFFTPDTPFEIFCGPGNNGGDGLALTRLLHGQGRQARAWLLTADKYSADNLLNQQRLEGSGLCRVLGVSDPLPVIPDDAVVVEALYGTGLSRPLEGFAKHLVQFINGLPSFKVSVDLPGGLPADGWWEAFEAVQADLTLTFHCPKPSLLMPDYAKWVRDWEIIDIGLHAGFLQQADVRQYYVDIGYVRGVFPLVRKRHAHKGHYGHAVLLGGSDGMVGALLMAAGACMRSGVGLLTAGLSESWLPVLHNSVPEAMALPEQAWLQAERYDRKTAVGLGMGWQPDDFHRHLLQWVIYNYPGPLLIDATGLALLQGNLEWLAARPKGSATILTPHTGEFDRLFGVSPHHIARLEKAIEMAGRYRIIIVLKGAYTQTVTPGGLVYFNGSGNPGMATGGSGDVLAGFITGLLAQRISPVLCCIAGAFLHGLAGDIAAAELTQQAMSATDIISRLPAAWKRLAQV